MVPGTLRSEALCRAASVQVPVQRRPAYPEILAIALPVWLSAFIRFAVTMCSESSTFRGHPNLVP
jgi:hypothetical protein